MADSPPQRTRAFVSYSHADAEHLMRLHVHLAPYTREHKVDVWDDTRITPGAHWKEEIRQAMAEAKVAILLVSADFMASDFIAHDELPPLLEAAAQEGTLIVPVILSHCSFQWSKLARFQSINNAPSDPLIDMPRGKQEAIWAKLAKYVADALIERERDLKPTPGPQKRAPGLRTLLKQLIDKSRRLLKSALLPVNVLLLSIQNPIKKISPPASPHGKIPRRALLLGGGLVLAGGLGVVGDLVWQAIQYRFLPIGTRIYTYRRHPITVLAVA